MAASENEIINVKNKKIKKTIGMEDINILICYRVVEALLVEEGINVLVPCVRSLFQSIESLQKVAHHGGRVRINEAK